MTDSALHASQMRMARYLRNPQEAPPPDGVEQRRLKIYKDLVYNNIEGFIRGGFPVLHSLYEPADWHALVHTFVLQHRCRTPYFLEISQEFVRFLLETPPLRDCDPPFLAELAHYEWVELALDIAEEELPEYIAIDDTLSAVIVASPLAWSLCYRFPVHRIGPGFRPADAGQPTYLAVYRNRQDQVQFLELNAATARLLELISANQVETAATLLMRLADELGLAAEAALAFGAEQLQQLIALSVVLVHRS